jgi:predicted transcriptional regulator
MAHQTARASQRRRELAEDGDWTLYKLIDKNPRSSMYELAKIIGWSHGKVHGSVKRLERDGLVKIENEVRGGRAVALVIPKEWQEFFSQEEMDEMKQPEFWDELEKIVKSGR